MSDQTLIERLSAAKVDSRELSDEVLLALGWLHETGWWRPPAPAPEWEIFHERDRPDPARSIDDAVRWVVPEGWSWTIYGPDQLGVVKPHAMLGVPGVFEADASAATPALALCIAGLKARMLVNG